MEPYERKILTERGGLPKEEGDAVREYKKNFLSSWLWGDGREKEERTAKVYEREKEKRRKKRTKRGESKDDVKVCSGGGC